MSQEIIDRVHFIADKQKTSEGLKFLRRDDTEFVDLPEAPAPSDNDNEPVEVIEVDQMVQ